MSQSTNYLDLDAIVPETELVVKFNGKEHKLQALSVEDFIKNMKDQAKLAESGGDVEAEIDLVIKMLTRSFPSMDAADLKRVELAKLWKLLEFARANNGSTEAEGETKRETASENPPKAG